MSTQTMLYIAVFAMVSVLLGVCSKLVDMYLRDRAASGSRKGNFFTSVANRRRPRVVVQAPLSRPQRRRE